MTSTHHNLFSRLWRYQAERYPVLFVFATTTAFVLALRHVLGTSWSIGSGFLPPAGLIMYGVAFLAHIRLLDELSDADHDRQYYPHRPLPRGLLTVDELLKVIYALMVAELFIAAMFHWKFLLPAALLIAFSWWAEHDFFLTHTLRRHFFLYNFLLTTQSFLGLLFMEFIAVGGKPLNARATLFLIFSYVSMLFLEFIRKIRVPEDENTSRDTYSSQLGPRGAIIGGGILLTLLIFLNDAVMSKHWQATSLIIWATLCIIYMLSGVWYIRHLSRRSAHVVQSIGVTAFFALFFLLFTF